MRIFFIEEEKVVLYISYGLLFVRDVLYVIRILRYYVVLVRFIYVNLCFLLNLVGV